MLVAFRGRERAPAHDGNAKHVEVCRRDALVRERDLSRADITQCAKWPREQRWPDSGEGRQGRVPFKRLDHRLALGVVEGVDQERISGAKTWTESRRCDRAA